MQALSAGVVQWCRVIDPLHLHCTSAPDPIAPAPALHLHHLTREKAG
jgi:hypothetical protein